MRIISLVLNMIPRLRFFLFPVCVPQGVLKNQVIGFLGEQQHHNPDQCLSWGPA